VPRDYSQRTPKKMKAAALRGALTDRARHERIHVVTGVVDGDISTKAARTLLGKITDRRKLLLVAERSDETAWLSARNLPRVRLLDPGQLNTYDVLESDDVVFTKAAFDSFVARATGAGAEEPEDAVTLDKEPEGSDA
jgi:large subunit ribosomal protein L4